METKEVVVDQDKARELFREYRKHQHWSQPIDDEIRRTYQLIAQGRVVIRALESIRAAGLNEQGLPKLAIIRAGAETCHLRPGSDGSAVFQSQQYVSRHEVRKWIGLPAGSFEWPTGRKWEYKAIVPMIPIHLRPKRGLANYHILWEAEWSRDIPVDPYLLRRIGQSDLWLVVAAWDLSEVERAAMAARVNA